MQPKISVIVPIYNGESYIERCINSILNQTFQDFELILIDDGSKDNSLEMLKKFEQIEKIKVYYQNNKGPSAARNKGIEKAIGKYLIFIDIDDWIEDDYIEILLNEIENNKLDFVTIGYNDISKYGVFSVNDFYKKNKTLTKQEILLNIFNGTGGVPWGKIYKRNIIIANKIKMNENIFMCEDQLFVLEYCLNSELYGSLNLNRYNYNRLNENSISNKIDIRYYDNFLFFLKKLENILKKYKVEKKISDQIMELKTNDIYEGLLIKLYLNSNLNNKFKYLRFFSGELQEKYSNLNNSILLERLKKEKIYKVHFLLYLRKIKRQLIEFIKFRLVRRERF